LNDQSNGDQHPAQEGTVFPPRLLEQQDNSCGGKCSKSWPVSMELNLQNTINLPTFLMTVKTNLYKQATLILHTSCCIHV